MRIRRLIIPSLCRALTGLGGLSLLAAILVFLGVERGGVRIGIVYGVVGLPFVIASLILSRWWDKRRATEQDGRAFGVLPLPPARRECRGRDVPPR